MRVLYERHAAGRIDPVARREHVGDRQRVGDDECDPLRMLEYEPEAAHVSLDDLVPAHERYDSRSLPSKLP